MKLIRNHGVINNFTDAWIGMGFNFKFTDIQASIGIAQLARLSARSQHLRKIYDIYSAALSRLPLVRLIPVDIANGELPLYIEILCDHRDDLIEFLKSRDIQARPFPPSLHLSSYLDNQGEFPNSSKFGTNGCYLPCGPEQPLGNVDEVIKALYCWAGQDIK